MLIQVEFLKNELGFDAAYNYHKMDVNQAVKEFAPQGIDVWSLMICLLRFDGESFLYD